MVDAPRNAATHSFHKAPSPEALLEIRALNWMFLDFLQASARAGEDCLGLDPVAARTLRDAPAHVIEGLAAFPRALFSLNLEHLATDGKTSELPRTTLQQTREVLCLSVLHIAWQMSRYRPFEGRLFLDLSAVAIRFLRTVPLVQLHQLRHSRRLLSCAFGGSRALWATLLRGTTVELPRAILLIGLQPHCARAPGPGQAATGVVHQATP